MYDETQYFKQMNCVMCGKKLRKNQERYCAKCKIVVFGSGKKKHTNQSHCWRCGAFMHYNKEERSWYCYNPRCPQRNTK